MSSMAISQSTLRFPKAPIFKPLEQVTSKHVDGQRRYWNCSVCSALPCTRIVRIPRETPYPTNQSNSARNPKLATILVGEEQERFIVHESVLTHYSEFFRAALTGGFAEATEKTVKLEGEDAETFEFFVHWLYYQRFPDKDKCDNPGLVERFYYCDYPNDDIAVKLYVFGDKYGIERLRWDSLDLLFRVMELENSLLPGNSTITYAFEHLNHQDPLCRLLVDLFPVYDKPDPEGFHQWYVCVPFLQAVWCRYISHCKALENGEENLYRLDLCNYHDHETGEERRACKKGRGDVYSSGEESDSD